MAEAQKTWKSRLVLPGLLLGSLLVTILLAFSIPVTELKLNVTDKLFDLRGPISIEDSSIVIVSISQQADQEIPYKYPWPTSLHAKLVEHLNEAGAKAIGFDVIFDKRDNYDLANDSAFAEMISKHGNVVLGSNIQSTAQSRGQGSSSTSLTIVRPNRVLQSANKNRSGIVRAHYDTDGAIREYILNLEYNRQRMYSLGLELLKLHSDIDSTQIDEAEEYLDFGSYKIPKFRDHLMSINYFGPPGTFPRYSFETVIDDSSIDLASEDSTFQINSFSDPNFGLKHTDVFKDKIVLVGATMPELHDLHATPFAEQGTMPGVEMHANAIQTILSGNYIYHVSPWKNIALLIIAIAVMVFAIRRLSGFWGFVLYLLISLSVIGVAIWTFFEFNIVIDMIAMLTAVSVGYITTQSYQYIVQQREKRRIQELFSSYVSPAIVEEMVEEGKEPELGGDEVYMTAFFSDIQSFSTFSEQMPAKTLVKLINEYLSAMTNIIREHGGTLDKYIGDAIVAFFGAPVSREDHAYQACVVSQLMQYKLADLREQWRAEGEQWPEIVQHMRNRIGINTGVMVTGNMGSESRFNYTMMGDNVNLAARCESGAKQFGAYTMVTKNTKEEAEKYGDRCVFRYLDRIVVKGRTEPVDVYEVMGLRDKLDKQEFVCKEKFEMGIEAYKRKQWDQAIELFQASSELESFIPNDDSFIYTNPSLVYLDRCEVMKENPPPEDWNGVYVMK
ncbi:CHASE2 domain-containing protein [Fodinibius sp. AD559]|uniref:CHASE2 domain-containing protein n=1 Tax=Fodinibius sp. AD559 TaxID=3424179 RepID=UPI004046AA5C